jgi:hypothetical protein
MLYDLLMRFMSTVGCLLEMATYEQVGCTPCELSKAACQNNNQSAKDLHLLVWHCLWYSTQLVQR